MLATDHHDPTTLMEVSIETWKRVLEIAGERERFASSGFDHSQLWDSLTSVEPGKDLLEALEVMCALGTEQGRDHILLAAQDQGIPIGQTDDESARELAVRLWMRSCTDASYADVLVRARINVSESAQNRHYREYVGNERITASMDKAQLRAAVLAWSAENKKDAAVVVFGYQREGVYYFEVLRGDPLKRVVEIRAGRPAILNFRPAASDHIRYEPESGRIGVATRSPRLLKVYRELLGSMLGGDVALFSDESVCTLQPLQAHGAALFEGRLPPVILQVAVVDLHWRRADRDKVSVQGRDCFRILQDLGAKLNEGELYEAKLLVRFAGRTITGRVSIKVPNRIDMHNVDAHEDTLRRLLSEVGIRGTGGNDASPRDSWSLYPYRLTEVQWRRHSGRNFDKLVQERLVRPVPLAVATHPDHPVASGALTVTAGDAQTVIGVSDDPAIGVRTLTASDYQGYELDLPLQLRQLQQALKLDGSPQELDSGLWDLGSRTLCPTATIRTYLAIREPSRNAAALIHARSTGACPVLVIPGDCSCDAGVPTVTFPFPGGPYDMLLQRVVETLGLQTQVPYSLWLNVDLILDTRSGVAWYRRTELTDLKAHSHPFKFAVEVARAQGNLVSKQQLNEVLSEARRDDEAAKAAKRDFIRLLQSSLKKAGVVCPSDTTKIFRSSPGGYALSATATVL